MFQSRTDRLTSEPFPGLAQAGQSGDARRGDACARPLAPPRRDLNLREVKR